MASITTEPNGHRTIQFKIGKGKRQSVRLGKVNQKIAEAVKLRVELIIGAKLAGHSLDDETSRWLGSIDQSLHEKLSDKGLVPRRNNVKLKAFVDQYIAGRRDLKPSTILHINQAALKLVQCYGANRELKSITPTDAEQFRSMLLKECMAENTTRRLCGRAKQFFNAAIRLDLVTKNPFVNVVSNVKGNPSRFYFLTADDAKKVLDACPDAQWRLIFALSRFGGLRCPSEHLMLRWVDIDWEKSRMRVWSPKTEHHEGRESRMVPLFPELRPHLEKAFELAKPGSEYVVEGHRSAKVNLRSHFERIILRAGLQPWPKLFQNLRSTRQTELSIQGFAPHIVCAWIGNTEAVANKHYLQVPESEFLRAAAPRNGDSNNSETALQNPVQHTPVCVSTARPEKQEGPAFAEKCEALQCCTSEQAPRQGLEPWTLRLTVARSTN